MKEILQLLKNNPKGLNENVLIRHIEVEITDMGGSVRTIQRYLHRLAINKLVKIRGQTYIITALGINWLERKVH